MLPVTQLNVNQIDTNKVLKNKKNTQNSGLDFFHQQSEGFTPLAIMEYPIEGPPQTPQCHCCRIFLIGTNFTAVLHTSTMK